MGKKLAIRGHLTRGKEVIELLQMMGGKNCHNLNGLFSENAYYVIGGPHNDEILGGEYMFGNEDIYWFTLEEFLKKYPHKVGDKVVDGYGDTLIIKSMSWSTDCETMVYDFEDSVIVLAAEDMKLVNDNKLSSTVENPAEFKSYTVSMKDDKVVDNAIDSAQFMQLGKTVAVCFNTANYENEVELQLGDYEIVVRDGKTYAVLKKSAYPDNYEECVRIAKNIHGYDINIDAPAYRELLESFVKLLICRDAYWKIAGEEMGLGKPWEPDWNDQRPKYTITVIGNQLIKHHSLSQNYILAFPTEEMRDAFYENFKDLIEQCKELL